MHDEAAFLLLEATQPWDEPVPSEWVLYMGDKPDRGPVGWAIAFDGERGRGSCEVDVTFETVPEVPPLPDASFADVVEVSAHGEVALMEGTWQSHSVAESTNGAWLRVRLSRRQPSVGRPTLMVQAWPAEPATAAILRAAEEPLDLWQMRLPEAEAGLSGAARIGDDVDMAPGHRTLSGELGTASAMMTLAMRLSRLTNLFEAGNIWTPALDGYSAIRSLSTDAAGETWSTCFVKDSAHPDHIGGTTMTALLSRPRDEHDPPRRSALWWRWGRPVPPFDDFLGEPAGYEPLLPTDARLDVRYEMNGDKTITVRLEHSQVPIEWVDDLTAWWTYQLAIARDSRSQ